MQAIYEMNGYAVAVNDGQILESQHKVASLDGTFICPEGAATLASVKLKEQGWLMPDEKFFVA